MGIFTKEPTEYKRDLDFVDNYIKQCAFFLARSRNISEEEATEFVRKEMSKDGRVKLKDKAVTFLHRDKKTGDRALKEGSILQYIDDVTRNALIMVPTLTVYYNPNQKKSKNAIWIARNLQLRKKYKGMMFTAKMKGDKLKYSYYDILQNSCKIKNNSLSGAHSSASTPLQNKSTHSTLTSTCRISTSYANANNEQFIAGNRHYWTPQVVFAHLICMSKYSNLPSMEEVMDTLNLYYPSVEDVMECIRYSSSLYWRSDLAMHEIRAFVNKLRPVERAAFVYSGDLYHLEKHNPVFVESLIEQLTRIPEGYQYSDKDKSILKDGDLAALGTLVCSHLVNGRELADLETEDPLTFQTVVGTAISANSVCENYQDFIRAFWRSDLLSPSIAKLPSIIRRAVVTSDTDSSIFTTQYWALKYSKGHPFSKSAYNTGYAITFLVSKMVKHKLAIMSTNLGFITEHLHLISMKNEYYFPVYSLTPAAKHYYAYRSAQEGRMLPSIETEIKGVHLRDSSAPAHVTKKLKQYMQMIMDVAMTGECLTLDQIYRPIAELERAIIEDVESGGHRYLKSAQIKNASAYSQGADSANYKRYTFWQETFAVKYGDAPKPPYQAVKITVNTDKPRKFKKWLESIEDDSLRDAINKWSVAKSKKDIGVIVVPLSIIMQNGVPREIIDAMDIRQLVKNIVSPFYLVLESLGIYLDNDDNTRLVSDTFILNEDKQGLKKVA